MSEKAEELLGTQVAGDQVEGSVRARSFCLMNTDNKCVAVLHADAAGEPCILMADKAAGRIRSVKLTSLLTMMEQVEGDGK